MSKEVAEKSVSSIRGLSQKEVEELYQAYANSFGDCEAPKDVSARHGDWTLVGHGTVTNSYCGAYYGLKICNRVELHAQSNLNGVSHAGEVYYTKVHRSCNNPQCPTCCFSGWARREADHITQRIEVGSQGYVDSKGKKHMGFGTPYHLIVSPPTTDWGLAEFQNEKFRVKVKKLLYEVGVIGGCTIFHGFHYKSYEEYLRKGGLQGWEWHPHTHHIAFIRDGYGKCRSCPKFVRSYRTGGGKWIERHGSEIVCAECDGFEARVRRSHKKNGYIIKCLDERATVFGTAWYALNHSSIRVSVK